MKLKFSCVVDNHPIFKAQAYILVNSLLSLAKIDAKDIYVHTLEKSDSEFYIWLNNLGVNVIHISVFSKENSYCNKLQQLKTFQDLDDYDYVMLLDCDIAVSSLESLDLREDVYAKIVDFPNPPTAILQDIYKAASLSFSECESSFSNGGKNLTHSNNCNGGVYMFSKKALNEVAPKWIKYVHWSIDNKHLFTEKYAKHADQVGFALAMSSLNKKVAHLEVEWNFPIHVNKDLLPNIKPNIIHFHNCINEHLLIKNIGLNQVDEVINKVNQSIKDRLSETLDNQLFWDLRYSLYPDLGSGVGSRGDVLDFKRELVKHVSYPYKQLKIIDVGCGDLELMKLFEFDNYIGLDVSSEALKIAKEKRPNWNFSNISITNDSIKSAELIFCFDVLIHQSKQEDFELIVKNIVEKSNSRIVIGAYNSIPEYSSTITHFYNSIIDEIKKHNKFNEVGIVAKYRDVSVIVATKHVKKHQRDIDSEKINMAFTQVKRPDLLQYIVDVSRTNLGFYTSHYPRVFEYSWLLTQLQDKKEGIVLDIGAGVCPLPFCLSEQGLKVITVDSHSKNRATENKKDWNEWGFLDYGLFDKKIESFNEDFIKFESKELLDCIYSISVIEHIPKRGRIKLVQKAAKLLKKGGILLLTIDLIPNTSNLWNLSEDKEVEAIEEHGNIESFKKELKGNGFEVVEEEIQRNILDSRTDVYYVKAVLKKKNKLFKIFNWL